MSRTYDIVIIGSGIAGSISAAILAKHGLKTLILDAGQHPRFSIGEAMTPESGLLLRLLAQRFGIPELAFIASPEQIVRHIGSSACGIKLAFSFAWHAAGVDSAAEHVVAPPLDARRPTCIARTSTSTPCCSRSSTARTPATTRASKDSSSFPRVWPSVSPTAKACKLAMSSMPPRRDRRSHVNWACAPPMAWQPTPAPSSPICST